MNVVIVDDTPLNLTLMTSLMRRFAGCAPLAFEAPLQALDWCLNNEHDLIIVDYMMPDLDGIEFIRRIRRQPGLAGVPVLMITSDHEKKTRYDALQAGATDFLNKPVDKHEFEPRVRNMLALREAYLSARRRAESLASEVRKATLAIHARERETVFRLARAAEFRDPETGAHIQRMAYYSSLIAEHMRLGRTFAEEILQAAPMHDVGKLGIPDHVLFKPGRLDADELTVMRRHPEIGYDLLKDSVSPVMQTAAIIALTHHERFDGSGYPHALAGDKIPLEGRIVAVADVFDALTTTRPYKEAWPLERAYALLTEGRGGHFDPECVDAFLSCPAAVDEIRQRFRED